MRPDLTPPRILCPACRELVERAGPREVYHHGKRCIIDPTEEARRRRAAYAGEPSVRAKWERDLMAAMGWRDLRGRGARRARLRDAIAAEQRDRPELFDVGYRRVGDTLRIKHLSWVWQDWLTRHRDIPRRRLHALSLPAWARDAIAELPDFVLEARGRRWELVFLSATDRLVAASTGIAPRTVRRRRQSRATWTPVEASGTSGGSLGERPHPSGHK